MKRILTFYSILFLFALLPFVGWAQKSASTKLTVGKVKSDLVGHKLSEGRNGYHDENWTWTIRRGSIGQFKVLKVVENTDTHYTFVAKMRLAAAYYEYDATCRIGYRRQKGKPWKFSYVKSLGLSMVVTHEYDDCIHSEMIDDGWSGLYLKNNSEMVLEVGGEILKDDGWERFSRVIKANGWDTVGGVMRGGILKSYRIHYIVREN